MLSTTTDDSCQLVEHPQLSGRVDHLQRERILVAADAANLPAVQRLHDARSPAWRRHGRRAAPAGAAAGLFGLTIFCCSTAGDSRPAFDRSGPDDPAARVHLVTARARGTAEEQRFAGGGVPRRSGRRGSPRPAAVGLQAAQIGDELPDLRVAQAGKWRHLGPAHAGPNRAKQIGVPAAVRERAGVQRRAAIAAALAGGTVARLTELAVQRLALGRRGGTAGRAGWSEGAERGLLTA